MAFIVLTTIGLGSSLLGATAADAADQGPPSGTMSVLYTGTSSNTSIQWDFTQTLQAAVWVNCSTNPCVLADQGTAVVEVVGGVIEFEQAQSGSLCKNTFVQHARWTGTVDADHLSLTIVGDGGREDGCDPSDPVDAAEKTPITQQIEADYDSGQVCGLDWSCDAVSSDDTQSGGGASGSGIAVRSGSPLALDEPSTFSALPTVQQAVTPPNVLWAAAITVVLVLLIAFPTHLLNTAVETGTDRLSAWLRARRARTGTLTVDRAEALHDVEAPAPTPTTPPPRLNLTGWPLAAVGVLAAAVVSAFSSPDFGLNAGSARVFLSIVVSFAIDVVLGWFALIWLVRRVRPEATAAFRFVPATLLVVVAAVLFTRLTGFQPGIVFGLVAGVAFGAIIATADKAKVTLTGLGYSFGIALVGWIGYSILSTLSGSDPGVGVVFVEETFSAMAIGGIAALPISLIPLRGLAGREVFRWNRFVWAGAYAVGLFGFFIVLLPRPYAWQAVSLSLIAWVGLYIAYAAIATGLWLAITRPWRAEPDDDSATAAPDDVDMASL